MGTVSTTPLVGRNSGLKEVKSWRHAPAFRRRGGPIAHGWYVPTPDHPGAVKHTDTSAAGTEYRESLGLGVTTSGAVHPVTAPNSFEMEIFAGDIAGDLVALARHTHGHDTNPDFLREVPDRLAVLLDAAAAAPTALRPRMTKRAYRQSVKDVYRYRDEKVFGPGGVKAYNKRMYGK